jgi:hypothetical protein
MPYTPFQIPSLGGLNEDENPAAIQPDQLRVALNCARLGSLTGTRPGLVRDSEYDGAIADTPNVIGIGEFRKDRDTTRTLVVITDDEKVWSAIRISNGGSEGHREIQSARGMALGILRRSSLR